MVINQKIEVCMNVTQGNSIKKQLRRLNKQKVSRGASLLKNCLIVMIVISENIGEKQSVNKKSLGIQMRHKSYQIV